MAIPADTAATLLSTDIPESEMQTMVSRVDADGARRIMSMLVDMYADPMVAVVREYVANAVDATILAGTDEPVRVTTPTLITPNLVISDRGTGMSSEEVEGHFLAFASSTKRGTNDLVGELGVGAKSAWTLCSSFVIDTVKDGKRTTVRASRDLEHNVLLRDQPTEMSTGTTITIPVDLEKGSWDSVVRRVAAAHLPGTVLVDDQEVASIHGGPSWIGSVRSGGHGGWSVTAGGTLFNLPAEIQKTLRDATRLSHGVLKLSVGSFDHTPSRESLIATERTNAAVDDALRGFEKAYRVVEKRLLKLAAKDLRAAVKAREEILDSAGSDAVLHLPYQIRIPKNTLLVRWRGTRGDWAWGSNTDTRDIDAVLMSNFLKSTLVVHDMPSRRTPRGLSKYMNARHRQTGNVLLLPKGESEVSFTVKDTRTKEDAGQVWTLGEDHTASSTYDELRKEISALYVPRSPTRTYPCLVVSPEGDFDEMRMPLSEVKELSDEDPSLVVLHSNNLYRAHVPAALRNAVIINVEHYSANPVRKVFPDIQTRNSWYAEHLAGEIAHVSEEDLDVVAFSSEPGSLLPLVPEVFPHIAKDHPLYELMSRITRLWSRREEDSIKEVRTLLNDAPSQVLEQSQGRIRGWKAQLVTAYPMLRLVSSWSCGEEIANAAVEYMRHTPPHIVEDSQTS